MGILRIYRRKRGRRNKRKCPHGAAAFDSLISEYNCCNKSKVGCKFKYFEKIEDFEKNENLEKEFKILKKF